MTQPSTVFRNDGAYFSDAKNILEMARLIKQGELYTRIAGGALSGLESAVPRLHDIVDLASGPGEWVLDVASQLPFTRITGVDLAHSMVSYGQHLAIERGLDNAQFQTGDILQPLNFPDASFDLVNARLLISFMPATYWPQFLQECLRITRPGGIVRMTECERWFGNTPAFERLSCLLTQALCRAGKTFSPTQTLEGITTVVGHLLRKAGCQNVQTRSFIIEFSAGTQAFQEVYENAVSLYQLTRPFMVKMDVVTEQEAIVLYHQCLDEMRSPEFCAIWPFVCAYGEKPQ